MDNARINNRNLFIGNLLTGVMTRDGRGLIELAEKAIAVRAFDALALIAAQLCEVPGVYSKAGDLYRALALNRLPGNRVLADAAFKQLVESQYPWIRARATLALGSNFLSGNPLEAITYYSKAVELNSQCPLNLFCSAMMTVAALSLEGKHSECLDSLNRMSKLAGYVGRALPVYGFDYLNSLAVELNATGHKDEARKIIEPVVNSPFAKSYPEWRETADEVHQELKPQTNVLAFPVSRPEQVRRLYAVALDKSLDGHTLKRGVDVLHKEVYRV
jgi:tetratricopeptide (TPR) repeat protein